MRASGLHTFVALGLAFAGCATAPKTASERSALDTRAEATLQSMRSADPGLDALLASAYGYAVFPEIGKGGLIAGAAYGRGVVYEKGRLTGYVELNQGSLGAQIGAQTFAELIVFRDRTAGACGRTCERRSSDSRKGSPTTATPTGLRKCR